MLLIPEIADGDGEFGVGAVLDLLNGEVFLEKPDHVFATQQSGRLAENEHGKPAIEKPGVEKGLFETRVEKEFLKFCVPDAGGIESGGESACGGARGFAGKNSALIDSAEESGVGVVAKEGGTQGECDAGISLHLR